VGDRVDTDLLGLFPPLDPGVVGGVQESGRIAWQGLVERGRAGRTHLFTAHTGRAGQLGAKLGTVGAILGRRWSAGVVLVWHLALLRLVPFFRLPPARLVVFLHGIEAWRPLDWMTRRLLPRVDLFLSNSDHTWARFRASRPELGAVAHRTVPLGVGEPLEGPTSPPDPAPAALMIGRLLRSEDYKGHRELLAAWPAVRARVPGAELWVAGDGDLRPELEGLARRGLPAGAARFWGPVPDAEKERLLRRARCLVLPSRSEGFGLVYLEAMRLGRPCLVSSLDAGREVVNPPEAGLAVDPRRPEELAAAVARLLASSGPEWRGWSAQARARYERGFTAAHFQSRLADALALAPVRGAVAVPLARPGPA
jgi:glycosyltransferase involved in cell wall biosynthesis